MRRSIHAIAAVLALSACDAGVDLAAHLDQNQAMQLVAALEAQGIRGVAMVGDADARTASYRVRVAPADLGRAHALVSRQNLLSETSPAAIDGGSAFADPSELERRDRQRMARDLERMLRDLPGVYRAVVVLSSPPPKSPVSRDDTPARTTAAVTVTYWPDARGTGEPPVAGATIRGLVASGVHGLAADDVTVVQQPLSLGAAAAEPAAAGPAAAAPGDGAFDPMTLLVDGWPWAIGAALVLVVALGIRQASTNRRKLQERRHASLA